MIASMIPATKFASTWRAAKPMIAAAIAPEASRLRREVGDAGEARERDRDADQDDHRVEQPAHEAQPGRALAREPGPLRGLAHGARPERAIDQRRDHERDQDRHARVDPGADLDASIRAHGAHYTESHPAGRARHAVGFEPPAPHLHAELHARTGFESPRPRPSGRSAPRSPTTARIWTRAATRRRCADLRRRCAAAMAPALPGTRRSSSMRCWTRCASSPTRTAAPALMPCARPGSAPSSSPTGTSRCTSGSPRPASRRCSTARSPPPRSARPSLTPRSSERRWSSRARPQDAWHVGDTPEADVEGARAAGLRPILIARDGAGGAEACPWSDRWPSSYPWRRPDDEPRAPALAAAGGARAAAEPPSRRAAEVPIWVPFVALLAVLVIVNMFGAAVVGILAATDPSIKSADDPPVGLQLGADAASRTPRSSSAPGSRSSSRSGARRASRSACDRVRDVGPRSAGRPSSTPASGDHALLTAIRQARRPGAGDRHQGRGLARVLIGLGPPDLRPGAVRGGVVLPRLHVHRLLAAGSAWSGRALLDRASSSASATRPRRADPADRARRVRSRVVPPLLAHTVHRSVHGLPRTQQFDHVRRGQRPRSRACSPASSCSASARSPPPAPRCPRVRGGRMKRAGLALLLALAVPATASAQTPRPTPTPTPAAHAGAPVPPPRSRSPPQDVFGDTRPRADRALVHRARRDEALRRQRDGDHPGLPRQPKKIQVKTLTFKPVSGGAAGVATMKVKLRQARPR